MKILGIDPGIAIVGFGIIEYDGVNFKVVDYGAVTSPAHTPLPVRLKMVYDDMCYIIDKFKPDQVAIEELFFNNNAKTAIAVGQARGVLILAAQNNNIPVYEYTPLQVKQGVVGYGRAQKNQVQQMVKSILKLNEVPKPDDTADALAIAVCHAHTNYSILKGGN
ncbi:MAG: crossover junction endodeoxyribonuclease RuvC [Clostridia bacterium]|nr:crossover junction endodeoxyribonuclease RuvC [Clostridia bacterium]MBQ7075259.1 crossover junction endodeoxyribonuclease RuvC [Clostridia bacterium]